MRRFLNNFGCNAPATDADLTMTEQQLSEKLPAEYVQFLKIADGGEGFIGKCAYVILWRAEELKSLNQLYEVHKYAPGFLTFGSDGGGEAYGFDTRAPQWPIVQLPFVGMDWKFARPMGESFSAFLNLLSEVV